MDYPAFFDDAPEIIVHDGLAQLLGAFSDGVIRYRYVDAVRLAGHSCPTVAGAYLMTRRALALLYDGGIPERGNVQVRFSADADEGVAGVVGSIVGLVTGAAGPGGFKGIGGNFRRQHLMQFSSDIDGEALFVRRDSGESVLLTIHLNRVQADPRTGALLRLILDGDSTPEDEAEFAALWQDRVRRLLTEHADDPDLFTVRRISPPAANEAGAMR